MSDSKTLTINCSGSGPVTLYAAAGTSSLSGTPYEPDGILKLVGADYVTIDGLTFRDTNTVGGATYMEFGLGFFKRTAGDGCNQNTVRNCSFYLNRVNNSAFTGTIMPEGSTAILGINGLANDVQFHQTVTNGGTLATNGTNSGNKLFSNSISGGNNGIVFIGYPATSGVGPSPNPLTFLGDLGNDIGGSGTNTGNQIFNFGGGGTNLSCGIRVKNGWNVNASYNTINNNDGTGVNHSGILRGIYGESGTSARASLSYNTITVKSNATSNPVYAIDNALGATAAGNKVIISGNNIINCSFTNQTSGNFYAISNSASLDSLDISSNSISTISLTSASVTSGIDYFIYNSGLQSMFLNVSNNSITDITGITATNGVHLIYTSGATQNQVISGNLFKNIRRVNTTTGSLYGFNNQSAPSGGILKFYNNTLSQMGAGGNASSFKGFNLLGSANQALQIYNNSFADIDLSNVTSSSSSNIIYAPSANIQSIYGNVIRRVNNGSSSLTLIYVSGASSSGDFYSNIISDITTGSTTTLIDYRGLKGNIYRNKIYNIRTNSISSQLTGFNFDYSSATSSYSLRIFNNLIGHFSAPSGNSDNLIIIMNFNRGYLANPAEVSYNTVYLNASNASATTFGATIVYSNNSSITLNFRNNILINTSMPKGSAYSSVIRAFTDFRSYYASASNNNFFYAGNPGVSSLIYYDPTYPKQNLQQYKSFVSPRESSSLTDTSLGFATFNPSLFFESLNGDDQNYLKPLSCNVSLLNRGQYIATITDDYNSTIRNTSTPDIGAWEVDNSANARVWLGVTNNDWNTSSNWCGGIPDTASNVVIPAGRTYYPVITSSTVPTPVCRNIELSGSSAASLAINTGGELINYGSWKHSGTITNYGKITLNGTGRQNFPGGNGSIFYLNTLKINCTDSVIIDRSITINGMLEPAAGIVKLDNDTITLKSNADTTASVGILGSNAGIVYSGTGKFTIERYIPSGRKWRHLAVPVNDDTLSTKYSWQEGASQTSSDPKPGFGTQITISNYGDWSQRGFDGLTQGGPSMKYYNATIQNYLPVTNTLDPIKNSSGYMIYIRGDRSCLPTNTKQSSTVLRLHGRINSGNQPRMGIPANGFTSVGNPYPSSIDIRNISKNRVKEFISIWDASLTGTYGAGRFEYLRYDANSGNFLATIGGGYYQADSVYNSIQSGQAYFVEGYGSGPDGWIDFKEDAKQTGSRNVFRPAPQAQPEFMRVTLLAIHADSTYWTADGLRIDFDNIYSSSVDENDFSKFPNPGESIGVVKGDKMLAIERRKKINAEEIIQLALSNTRQGFYCLHICAGNLLAREGMEGWLVDRFTGSRTLIDRNGTIEYRFGVTPEAGSKAGDRFYFEFKRKAAALTEDAVPVAFSVKSNIIFNIEKTLPDCYLSNSVQL